MAKDDKQAGARNGQPPNQLSGSSSAPAFAERQMFSAKDVVYLVTIALSVSGVFLATRAGLDGRLLTVEDSLKRRQPLRDYLDLALIHKQVNGLRLLEQATASIEHTISVWSKPIFEWETIQAPDWSKMGPIPAMTGVEVAKGPAFLLAIETQLIPLDDIQLVTHDQHFLALPDRDLVADVFALQQLILVFNRAFGSALASPDPRNPPGIRGFPSESLEGKRRQDIERFLERAAVLVPEVKGKLNNLGNRLRTQRESLQQKIAKFENL